MRHAMHVNTGHAGYIRAHVGMQQRRHALQQGEQRYQDRMADLHDSIIETESFTPLTWRKLRYDARATRPVAVLMGFIPAAIRCP